MITTVFLEQPMAMPGLLITKSICSEVAWKMQENLDKEGYEGEPIAANCWEQTKKISYVALDKDPPNLKGFSNCMISSKVTGTQVVDGI